MRDLVAWALSVVSVGSEVSLNYPARRVYLRIVEIIVTAYSDERDIHYLHLIHDSVPSRAGKRL